MAARSALTQPRSAFGLWLKNWVLLYVAYSFVTKAGLGTWLQFFLIPLYSVNENNGASEMEESKQLQFSQQANSPSVSPDPSQPTPVAFRCSHPASANNSGVSPARRIILQSAGSFRSCWFVLEDIHTNRGVFQSTIWVGSCQNTVTVDYSTLLSTLIEGPK